MERSTVSSSYWKIPDSNSYLSAVAAHESLPYVAVASGSAESNLFIYELDLKRVKSNDSAKKTTDKSATAKKPILTHHQTISLPGIHSLAWASPSQSLGKYGNVLVSGHKSGLVHLTLLPDPSSDHEPAEILRRFNHNRHTSPNEICKSTRIKTVGIVSNSWHCCAESTLYSLFNENLFLWDPSRSDVPVLKKRAKGVLCTDSSPMRDGILALGGSKGVSIMDVRVKDSPGLSPPEDNSTVVSKVKWSPLDENHISSVHEDSVVKVWDIRAGKPMVSLNGHSDRINSIQWSPCDSNEISSASCDGTIRIWDIQSCIELQSQPPAYFSKVEPLRIRSRSPLNDELNWLPKPLKTYRKRLSRYDDIFSEMNYLLESTKGLPPPSTTVVSHGKEFLAVTALRLKKETQARVISIDTDGFFGLHTRHQPQPRISPLSRSDSYGSSSLVSTSSEDGQYFSDISTSPEPQHSRICTV